jgi:hypothetical protein
VGVATSWRKSAFAVLIVLESIALFCARFTLNVSGLD